MRATQQPITKPRMIQSRSGRLDIAKFFSWQMSPPSESVSAATASALTSQRALPLIIPRTSCTRVALLVGGGRFGRWAAMHLLICATTVLSTVRASKT
eukprot:5109785-Pyramimonas_sp.AAC.1